MTAHYTTRTRSDNSGSTQPDPDLACTENARRIVEYVADRSRTTTLSGLAVEAGWTLAKTRQILEFLEWRNQVQLVETTGSTVILLTERGEGLAAGGR
jgi:hypothetical protein